MQLHELKTNYRRQRSKRIGRGGKRGTYSGKGQKGQRSRAGHRIRPAERDLISKLPKLRGIKNSRTARSIRAISAYLLQDKLKGGVASQQTLYQNGLTRSSDARVKIVSSVKKLNKKIIIVGLSVTEKAKKQIEEAGGKVI